MWLVDISQSAPPARCFVNLGTILEEGFSHKDHLRLVLNLPRVDVGTVPSHPLLPEKSISKPGLSKKVIGPTW